MTRNQTRSQIVVAFDFSPSAELALARAIEIVLDKPGHVLHVATILDGHDRIAAATLTEGITYGVADQVQVAVTERVTEAFAERSSAAAVRFFVHARIGKVVPELLMLASELGADLIIVGSHSKRGVERVLLGSVSERIVREAGCTVVVAREKAYGDVQLLDVTPCEHTRAPHHPPRAYAYINRQVIVHPADWPLG